MAENNPSLASQKEWAEAYFDLHSRVVELLAAKVAEARECDCGCSVLDSIKKDMVRFYRDVLLE
jgi:hypothetical protein